MSCFCNAYECDNAGKCTFDLQLFVCTDCSGGSCPALKECSAYADEITCPSSKCEYITTSIYDDENGGDDRTGLLRPFPLRP